MCKQVEILRVENGELHIRLSVVNAAKLHRLLSSYQQGKELLQDDDFSDLELFTGLFHAGTMAAVAQQLSSEHDKAEVNSELARLGLVKGEDDEPAKINP